MTRISKRLLCSVLVLMLLATLVPVAMAELTALQIQFSGMYATRYGDYEAVALSGSFDVYQDGVLVSRLNVTPDGDNTINLPGSSSVQIVPVMDTIPMEIRLNQYGYNVSITEGRVNIAPLSVFADAGLFSVRAGVKSSFELIDRDGKVTAFDTNEKGVYHLPRSIATGEYTLRMTASAGPIWPDQTVQITSFSGEDAIPVIEVKVASTAQPTAIPTLAPTATPVPTAVPTATPVPAEGVLTVLAEEGALPVPYQISSGAMVIADGILSTGTPAKAEALSQGEYLVTLMLPENAVLTSLNGNSTAQRGNVQWCAAVTGMKESVYSVDITETGSMMLPLEGIQVKAINLSGPREQRQLTIGENGSCTAEGLLPDTYAITVVLAEADYVFDANRWKMLVNPDGTYVATTTFTVKSGEMTALPAISVNSTGTVSGVVYGTDGKPVSGVRVTISDTEGKNCANVQTDKNGTWNTALPFGGYSVQYGKDGAAFPADSFQLGSETNNVQLTVKAAAPAKIAVRVFEDKNNNGEKNKNEGYVKDTEIALIAADGTIAGTALTDQNGLATLFAPAGKYTLRATAPIDYGFGKQGDGEGYNSSLMAEHTGRTQISSQLTLVTDKTLEVGIGVKDMAAVTGTVWNDLNADGVWQDDEPGIPGILVTITGTRNDVYAEAVTDENGFYALRQLKKGAYKLNCHVPDEYVFTGKAAGKNPVEKISRMTKEADRVGVDEFSLDEGEKYSGHNIGMMDGVIIEGVCFLDANFNGYFDDGEKPLPGVEMRLARQSNNVMLQHTVSDHNGVYHFYGQRGSTFTIRANLPAGYVFSTLGSGENGNRFAPNGMKTERRLTDVTIENGGYMKVLLGAVTYGSISGKVYFDENFSAAWEKGEAAGNGFLVTLTNAAGEKILSKRTDKSGNFEFEDLNPGQYLLQMTPEKGYAFTALGNGNVMKTLDDGSGLSRMIVLEMGQDVKDAGIGMIIPAKVSGLVLGDANDNGLRDQGEMGLSGTVVRLMTERGEAESVTVGDNGEFRFNSVLPGTYRLQYELPAEGLFAPVVNGGNAFAGENGIAAGEWFTVQTGDVYTAPLCAGTYLSSISGTAFADSNGNGLKEADEDPLAGVKITLTPSRSDLKELSVQTTADGRFVLDGLRADEYTLTVVCPDASVLSRMPAASIGLKHGLNSQSVKLSISMGTVKAEQMLGCVLPSEWTGMAYLDENYDGFRAANEAPAAGETILLLDASTKETVTSVKTDENGMFIVKGIAPGEYELGYVLDEGNLVPKAGDNHLHQEGNYMTTGRVRVKENEDISDTVIAVVRTTEIAGDVWLEKHDGISHISGARVLLLDASGMTITEYTTAEDGRYIFKGLMPGEYAIDVTIPSGYAMVESDDPHLEEAGLISVISEADGLHGRSSTFTLRMAKHLRDLDVGSVLPGRLGDKVWLDLNGNGLQDGGEGGIPGVTIELMRGERVIASTVSDQYGYYVFENIYPAVYTVRAVWSQEITPTILRTDIEQIVSVLQENGISVSLTVESNKANYAADLGFVLVEEDKLPAGYGEGAQQVWKKK